MEQSIPMDYIFEFPFIKKNKNGRNSKLQDEKLISDRLSETQNQNCCLSLVWESHVGKHLAKC